MKTLPMLLLPFMIVWNCPTKTQPTYLCVYAPLHEAGHMLEDSISFMSDDGVQSMNLLITNAQISYFVSFIDNSEKIRKEMGNDNQPELVQLEEKDSAGGHYIHSKLVSPWMAKMVDTQMVVWKEFDSRKLMFRYGGRTFGATENFYGDTLFPMHWTLLSDEEKKFGSLVCKKAVADFKNQHMVVWYCPDIPIPDGPWKLGGLPGLIVCWEQPADKALLLQSIRALPAFPDHLLSQWHILSATQIPDYVAYRKMLNETARKAKLYWQQEKSNCVSCQHTDNVKLTQKLTLYHTYEGIKYVFDL